MEFCCLIWALYPAQAGIFCLFPTWNIRASNQIMFEIECLLNVMRRIVTDDYTAVSHWFRLRFVSRLAVFQNSLVIIFLKIFFHGSLIFPFHKSLLLFMLWVSLEENCTMAWVVPLPSIVFSFSSKLSIDAWIYPLP